VGAALLLLLLLADPAAPEAELRALEALAAGRPAEALAAFEAALRATPDSAGKARLRDLYLKVGPAPEPPLSPAEQAIVARHVAEERIRVYTLAADRFRDKDELHASILVRRAVIELLGLDAGRAKEQEEEIRSLTRKLTEQPTDADRELAAQVLKAKREGKAVLKAAEKLLEQRQYRAVVRVCQEVGTGEFDQEEKNAATDLRRRTEERALADVPAAQKEAAKTVLADERFDRLDVRLSRHFIHLGPKVFVAALPPRDLAMLDLAYIYQSDLAAQPLTADGIRICVYYQETFEFGGGLAGGKLIRIGDRAIRPPIAGMLHYHELGHCIFGRGWLHQGFTEGLADFAAGFTLDALGQTADAQHFITSSRDQFVRYFLGRDVRYFDIQPYRPSAGFLFMLLPPGEAPFDWTPYRTAFRQMRDAQFSGWPEREHQIMRFFGYLVARHYGPGIFDTLAEWGWPVSRDDFARVPAEAETLLAETRQGLHLAARGDHGGAGALLRGVLEAEPQGPLAPSALYGLLQGAVASGDLPQVAELKRLLGIVDGYLVLGPYHARQQTAYVVLPPETSIDTTQPVPYGFETAHWKPAKVEGSGFVDLRAQGYGYPEHACACALAYVRSETEQPARIWVGSDDGHTLLLNGELMEKRDTRRGFTFDDDFVDVTLRRGWNRVLLKVHNGDGAWGFLLRIVGRDGRPLPGLVRTAEDHEAEVARFQPPKGRALTVVADEFKGFASTRWIPGVGKWDARNGFLQPQGTEKHGLWQRFLVDPDKPKDGPANILWLRSPDLARLDSFDLELVVAGGKTLPGKFGLTIDGENENDAQSGHTFVLDESDGKLRCHWYRYDKLLYLQPGAEVAPAESHKLSLRRSARKWWLSVDGVALFEAVDAARLPSLGVGLQTWGNGPAFDRIKLTAHLPE